MKATINPVRGSSVGGILWCALTIVLVLLAACSRSQQEAPNTVGLDGSAVQSTATAAQRTIAAAEATLSGQNALDATTPEAWKDDEVESPSGAPVFQSPQRHVEIRSADGVKIAGDLAVVTYNEYGGESGFAILDLRNLETSTILSNTQVESEILDDVAILGDRLFIAETKGVLQIFDIADPHTPKQMSVLQTTSPISAMTAMGDRFLLLGTRDLGVVVVDISSPTSALISGNYRPSNRLVVYDIHTESDLAFISLLRDYSFYELHIVNMEDPERLETLAVVQTEALITDVAVKDAKAFMAIGQDMDSNSGEFIGNELRVLNISNPEAPVDLAAIPLHTPTRIVADGDWVFAATSLWDEALVALPIAEIERAEKLVVFQDGALSDFDVTDGLALISDVKGIQVFQVGERGALQPVVLDITPVPRPTPTPTVISAQLDIHISQLAMIPGSGLPRETEWWHLMYSSPNLVVDGGYAYVAAGSAGLHIVDVRDPVSPQQVMMMPTEAPALTIKIVNHVAYIGTDHSILVVDVQNPENPKVLQELSGIGYPHMLDAHENMLVKAAGKEFEVYDTTGRVLNEPTSRVILPEEARGVYIDPSGTSAYLATKPGHVQAVDLSDPQLPSIGGTSWEDVGFFFDFDEKYAYSTLPTWFRVWDIDPAGEWELAAELGRSGYSSGYDTFADARNVTVVEGRAYVADYRNGLYIISLDDSGHPFVRGYFYPGLLWWAHDVHVDGDIVYLSSYDGGLRTLVIREQGIAPLPRPTTTPIASLHESRSVSDSLSGQIVFLSSRDSSDLRSETPAFWPHDLYAIDPDSGELSRLSTGLELSGVNTIAVSPDGETIAIATSGSSANTRGEIRFNSPAGQELRTLPLPDQPGQSAWLHDWSASNKILMTIAGDPTGIRALYQLDVNSGEYLAVTGNKENSYYGTFSPRGDQIAFLFTPDIGTGSDQLWLMNSDGTDRRLLLDRNAYAMAWSPDGRRIAFESYTDPNTSKSAYDIWLVNTDGTDARNLTNGLFDRHYQPQWSPDSTRVAFAAAPKGPYHESQIYVIEVDTGDLAQLTFDGDNIAPYWVPGSSVFDAPEPASGDLIEGIAFLSSQDYSDHLSGAQSLGPHDVYVMAPDGSQQRRITSNQRFANMSSPAVSPDGTRIALGNYGRNIRIYDQQGNQTATHEVPGDPNAVWVNDWSPDGARLLVTVFGKSSEPSNWNEEIYSLDLGSGNWLQLTDNTARNLFAAWSPDGEQIAYMHDYTLWLMNADGSNKRQLIDGEARDLDWSPDGNTIAFESWEEPSSGTNYDIYLVNADGTGRRRLTDSGDLRLWDPTWSPDGEQIAIAGFPEGPNSEGQIFVVDVDSGQMTQLTSDGDNFAPYWYGVIRE